MSASAARAAHTDATLERLRAEVLAQLGADAERILRKDTCIYVVGSGGRGEMSKESDVDLFVARTGRAPSDVDGFVVRHAVARAFYALGLPDPSQAGEFLKIHTAQSLCEGMGTPSDDATNTLTARMLLLLESRPLVGDEAYARLVARVVDAYWKNVNVHARDYQPFVLLNDIVRYWRTLLLNYVAKLAEKERELEEGRREGDQRLRSYKLRFSRCMTCFSTLARLLVDTAAGAVTREQVIRMIGEAPRARLAAIASAAPRVAPMVEGLLDRYEVFLEHSATPKDALLASFGDPAFARARGDEARLFGDEMFDLLQALGAEGRARTLFRHMVV